LTNDAKSPGDITFGGYNLQKYAKPGEKIQWVDQSANEHYWASNAKGISFGPDKGYITRPQTVIFDNGVSLAVAPIKPFISLVKKFQTDYGMKCGPGSPVWGCQCTDAQYNSIPDLTFEIYSKAGAEETVKLHMPRFAFMRFDPG
jgi:hypothetical protein